MKIKEYRLYVNEDKWNNESSSISYRAGLCIVYGTAYVMNLLDVKISANTKRWHKYLYISLYEGVVPDCDRWRAGVCQDNKTDTTHWHFR